MNISHYGHFSLFSDILLTRYITLSHNHNLISCQLFVNYLPTIWIIANLLMINWWLIVKAADSD